MSAREATATRAPEIPLGRGAQRAQRQFARLLKAILDEFGIEDPTPQAKALGLPNRQTVEQLFDGKSDKDKGLSEDNYLTVEAAVRRMIRERGGQRAKGRTRGAMAVSIGGTCRPLAMLGKLRQRIQGRYIPQRFLYDSDEAARLWETAEQHGGDGDRATSIAGVRSFAQTYVRGAVVADDAAPIELISLGCGNGVKEFEVLRALEGLTARRELRLHLVDSSLPLLCDALKKMTKSFQELRVTAHCIDIEDGEGADMKRWAAVGADSPRAPRLVMMLGNVFGSLENEPHFVRTQLPSMLHAGDLLWLEVPSAVEATQEDPVAAGLGRLPLAIEKATEPFDRLLTLPYLRDRRLDPLRDQDASVSLHADRAGPSSIRDSYNLRYWLSVERGERRYQITVLYARRYKKPELQRWFESNGFRVVASEEVPVTTPTSVTGWIHLLLKYEPESAAASRALSQKR